MITATLGASYATPEAATMAVAGACATGNLAACGAAAGTALVTGIAKDWGGPTDAYSQQPTGLPPLTPTFCQQQVLNPATKPPYGENVRQQCLAVLHYGWQQTGTAKTTDSLPTPPPTPWSLSAWLGGWYNRPAVWAGAAGAVVGVALIVKLLRRA